MFTEIVHPNQNKIYRFLGDRCTCVGGCAGSGGRAAAGADEFDADVAPAPAPDAVIVVADPGGIDLVRRDAGGVDAI